MPRIPFQVYSNNIFVHVCSSLKPYIVEFSTVVFWIFLGKKNFIETTNLTRYFNSYDTYI